MKIATIIVRSLLGLLFVFAGLNMLLQFAPLPPFPERPAQDFMKALFASHYSYVVGALQAVGGLLLLTGRWTPLGLTLVGPVVVNILTFHTFMDHSGLPIALIVSALSLFLLWRYHENFAGLVKDTPARADSRAQQIPAQTATVN